MNFLAHCLIGERATGDPRVARPLIAGGFLGDFIKGRVPAELPAPTALGVRLHRRIDAFSNAEPGIRASCQRFPSELRRFAPILVDILADHMLAQHWSAYHEESIEAFTTRAYAAIHADRYWLTDRGREFLDYARRRDLFADYANWDVTLRAMRNVTARLRRSDLDAQLEHLQGETLSALEKDFEGYFPALLDHARGWVAGQNPAPPS